MQITITHNSELRLRKVDALHRTQGNDYPVSGDNHHPSVGEECEVAKHESTRQITEREYMESLARVFKETQNPKYLTKLVDVMENQEVLF